MRSTRARFALRFVLPWLLLGAGASCDRKFSIGTQPLPSGAVPVTSYTPPPPPPPIVSPPGAIAPASFADLAARADPAVVFVKTISEQRGFAGRRVVGEGLGSAFVYDPSGLILTNNHVIEGATAIRVIFGRTRVMDATVVG
ncbi:MAG TPA: trypsin-like peptidase domain-containing protein, partial [Polyangiaceae bacterium]